MNSSTVISEEQRDALQELMNISMGQAANALARLIEIRVTLSIPKITVTDPAGLEALFSDKEKFYFARQSFMGDLRGEVIAIISHMGCDHLAEVMDYPQPMTENSYNELVLELTNILAGACLQGLVEQLSTRVHLAAPCLFDLNAQRKLSNDQWQHALLLEISFSVETMSFYSSVVVCLDEASIVAVTQKINRLLN
jgi:chemotaxis protein CheC